MASADKTGGQKSPKGLLDHAKHSVNDQIGGDNVIQHLWYKQNQHAGKNRQYLLYFNMKSHKPPPFSSF